MVAQLINDSNVERKNYIFRVQLESISAFSVHRLVSKIFQIDAHILKLTNSFYKPEVASKNAAERQINPHVDLIFAASSTSLVFNDLFIRSLILTFNDILSQ